MSNSPKTKSRCKKSCEHSKICNELSGRCVNKSGVIGKRILNEKLNSKSRSKCKKKCENIKICNEKTGRCVNKNGIIGKKIMKLSHENGIKVDGKLIAKISGPMSVRILKPKLGLELPLILLFGDLHSGIRGICKCKEDETCYIINSKRFIKHFDNIATIEKPIDFFVESFKYKRDIEVAKKSKKHIPRDFMSSFTQGPYMYCFFKEDRGTELYKKNCPANNIRWHYGDIRHLNPEINTLEEWYSKFFFESQFFALKRLSDNFIKNKNIEDASIIKNTMIQLLQLNKYNLKQVLLSILSDNNSLDYVKFAKEFFKEIKSIKRSSQIYKQIISQEFFNNFDYWEKVIAKIVEDSFNNILYKQFKKNLKTRIFPVDKISKFIDFLFFEEELPITKQRYNEINNILENYKLFDEGFLTPLQNFFLDAYFILRSFKNPGYLSIGYFGNYHTESIERILVDFMEIYDTILLSKSNEDEQRCVKIDGFFDFDEFFEN